MGKSHWIPDIHTTPATGIYFFNTMKIKISSLKEGVHEFYFSESAEQFAANFEDSFVAPVEVQVRLQKFDQNYTVDFSVKTQMSLICDRCLNKFNQTITADEKITYTTDVELAETNTDDDLRLLSTRTIELDLADDVRDNLILAIPTKKVCSSDCKGICPHCGADLNSEACTCAAEAIDPRWAKLKGLIH